MGSSARRSNTLIVIAGPTAVGKTALSIGLAKRLATEIVSADSRQFFREMSIGTAKPTATELLEVKHHLVNSHSINDDYDAAAFAEDALQIINQIFESRKYAVLCGGSGLYIRSVCEGLDEIPEIDEAVRNELVTQFERHGIDWLQGQMKLHDPELFATIDQQNPHRLIRALEVKLATGHSISTFRRRTVRQHDFQIRKYALELPRELLYERIDQRMDAMLAEGLVDEAKSLYHLRHKNALQTVGYQEIFDYLDGSYDYDEMTRLLKRNSRRYAKRQLTWFRKDKDFTWLDARQDAIEKILNDLKENP